MSTLSTTTSMDHNRQESSLLTRRDAAPEARVAASGDSLPPLELPQVVLADVRKISQEIFPGKCEFTTEFDPEYPDDRYLVANVEARGDFTEIVDRECLWGERIERLSVDLFRTLRLSIKPL